MSVPVLLALDLNRAGYLPNGLNGGGLGLARMEPPSRPPGGNRTQVTPAPSASGPYMSARVLTAWLPYPRGWACERNNPRRSGPRVAASGAAAVAASVIE